MTAGMSTGDVSGTPRGSVSSSPGMFLTVDVSSRLDMSPVHLHRTPSASRRVGRSQSMRTSRRPQSLEPHFRQRIASIPNDIAASLPEDELLRLRNFSVTNKGLVNRGDSFRSKSRSSHSVNSRQPEASAAPEIAAAAAAAATPVKSPDAVRHRVMVVGTTDVGKTSLINQFMTSEYICVYDGSQDEENERSVAVVLNGEEAELSFSEFTLTADSEPLPNSADAYVVVYSVASKRSFRRVKGLLDQMDRWDERGVKTVILVGNKIDLVRLRSVTTDDGRALATYASCKFIEISVGINHHVDELLAGLMSQIRLRYELKVQGRATKCSCSGSRARGILKRFLRRACSRSKSCDNLLIL